MKDVQISDAIVPLGDSKAQAAKLLKRIGESGEPMVITQDGRPGGVLLSPREYDRIQEEPRRGMKAGPSRRANAWLRSSGSLREMILAQ